MAGVAQKTMRGGVDSSILEPEDLAVSRRSSAGVYREKGDLGGCGAVVSVSRHRCRLFTALRLPAWRFLPVHSTNQSGSLWLPSVVNRAARQLSGGDQPAAGPGQRLAGAGLQKYALELM
jgi:hypothetical protein